MMIGRPIAIVSNSVGRNDRAEQIALFEMNQAGIGAGQNARHVFLGKHAGEDHLLRKPLPLDFILQPLARRAIADQAETDVGSSLVSENPRGFDDDFQPVGHPDRPDVRADEFVFEIPDMKEPRIGIAGHEALQIDTVGHHRDPVGNVDFLEDPLTIPVADGDDVIGGPVHLPLQPFQNPQQRLIAQGSDRANRLGPDVANLQDERRPLQPFHEYARPAAEKLRRRRDDDIRPGLKQAGQHRAHQIRKVIDDPPQRTGIGSQIRPDPHDPHAVHGFRLGPEPILIPLDQHAIGAIRRAGDHRHVVAGPRPAHAMLVSPRGRSVDLRRIIMTQKQNPHRLPNLPFQDRASEKCQMHARRSSRPAAGT
jgi:hypothetical protein